MIHSVHCVLCDVWYTNLPHPPLTVQDMLREVCEALLHVCSSSEFQEAAVGDAFFKEGIPLTKAIQVITKHSLMSPHDIAQVSTYTSTDCAARHVMSSRLTPPPSHAPPPSPQLTAFKNHVSTMALDSAALDALLGDAPEEFLDPLLLTLMEDPGMHVLHVARAVCSLCTLYQILTIPRPRSSRQSC